jgi:predicted outer membrane protein
MLRLTRLARNAALCALLAAPAAALAQQGDTQTDPQQNSQSSQGGALDSVLSKLDQKNQQEIQLGLLGIVRAESDEVAEFAKTMVSDHSDAVVRIYELARSEKVKLTPSIEGSASSASGQQQGTSEDRPTSTERMGSSSGSGSDREQIRRLTQLQGAEFDRAYVGAMVSAHEQMLQELQQAQQTVTNEEAKDLIGDLVSKVEDHRDSARELAQKVGASAQPQSGARDQRNQQQQQQQRQQQPDSQRQQGDQRQQPDSQRPDASR